jgi:Tol biopolymer transport system component
VIAIGVLLRHACAAEAHPETAGGQSVSIVGHAAVFAPHTASTEFSEIRLTISPDGRTALWFSRDRPGGAGGYDIWMSRRSSGDWQPAQPVPFNSAARDFDPAFSPDGRFVYFCSDRRGGRGGDDIYRVDVSGDVFGEPENLGATVNSPGNEFAPMLSGDQRELLFSSDRAGGAGGHDLYAARRDGDRFDAAESLPGDINTKAHEFDATFLRGDRTIVFARAQDFSQDRIDLYYSSLVRGSYDAGLRLPETVNDTVRDTYGAMIDWSQPDRLLFSAQRNDVGMDLYSVRYRLGRALSPSAPR